jgi:lipopolysaccharide/colanic/teichoic acid biosynthesis glycosyltransferase
MLKRAADLMLSIPAALLSAPIVLALMATIWAYDRGNPLYIPRRIGRRGKPVAVFKLRTMIVGADRTGVDSTAKGDSRLLPFAETLRRFKLDELPQFWNVIIGNMSLVGPRPNVIREVEKYTDEELRLLTVKPGLTDLSSIVFSDLADRVAGSEDVNRAYETNVRPWKSQLGLFYVDNRTLSMDLAILGGTAVSLFNRDWSLVIVCRILKRHGAPHSLIAHVCGQSKAGQGR